MYDGLRDCNEAIKSSMASSSTACNNFRTMSFSFCEACCMLEPPISGSESGIETARLVVLCNDDSGVCNEFVSADTDGSRAGNLGFRPDRSLRSERKASVLNAVTPIRR